MNLPDKTFLKKTVTLHESDFDCNGDLKLNRIMQLLQDAATEHAEQLGLGWKAMDGRCMVWMISKIKVTLHRAVGRSTPPLYAVHVAACAGALFHRQVLRGGHRTGRAAVFRPFAVDDNSPRPKKKYFPPP